MLSLAIIYKKNNKLPRCADAFHPTPTHTTALKKSHPIKTKINITSAPLCLVRAAFIPVWSQYGRHPHFSPPRPAI